MASLDETFENYQQALKYTGDPGLAATLCVAVSVAELTEVMFAFQEAADVNAYEVRATIAQAILGRDFKDEIDSVTVLDK